MPDCIVFNIQSRFQKRVQNTFSSLLRYLVRKTRVKWTVESAKLPPILVWFLFEDSAMRAERGADHPLVMRRVFCIIKYNLGPISEEPPAAAKKQLPILPPAPPSTDSTLAASSADVERSPKKTPAETVKLDEDSNSDEAREEEGGETQETKEQEEQEKAESANE